MIGKKQLTIIVLTFNEEHRIIDCLDSIEELDVNVLVVDSYSTDATIEILNRRSVPFLQHSFEDYSKQRNWAQKSNPFNTDWVMHIDADERLSPELHQWLKHFLETEDHEHAGYMFSRRTVFLGKWIRHGGHYPAYHLRLYRTARGHCEAKAYDQHFIVDGTVCAVPRADLIDMVAHDLTSFVTSHNRWATFEALELASSGNDSSGEVQSSITGSLIERRRWFKQHVFGGAPILVRAFLYFIYRYVFRLGFLDGREGLIFHVLQGFWFRFLVDAKLFEDRERAARRVKP